MPDSIGILAQVAISNVDSPPGATVVYTVPSATQTSISSIIICNQDGSNRTVDIAILNRDTDIGSQFAVEKKNYIFKGLTVNTGETKIISPGITLSQFNAIAVQGEVSENISLNIFGIENSE